MPPKVQFSKEQIVEAALGIAREQGIDQITIREVAKRLGSSIAPIYVNFEHVEELKQAVVDKVLAVSSQIIREEQTGHPFRDIGRASLRFAREYPVIVLDLLLKPNQYLSGVQQQNDASLLPLLAEDPELEALGEQQRMRLLLKMRIFHTGLTVMSANNQFPEGMDTDQIEALLEEAGEQLLQGELQRGCK